MVYSRRFWRISSVAAAILIMTMSTPHEAAAANCSVAKHAVVLTAGTASPGSGSTSTTFRFTVTYQDDKGCPPNIIKVVIGGVSYPLSQAGGATFSVALKLPVGSWSYYFYASSGSGAGQSFTLTDVSPSVVSVTVAAPPPTPGPTPAPTPAPTPRLTPVPTPGPTSTPASVPTTPPHPTGAVSSSTPLPTPVGAVSSPVASAEATNAIPPDAATAWNDHGDRDAFAVVALPARPAPPPGPGAAGSPDPPAGQATLDRTSVPRPMVALGIASVATIWGLGFFVVLSRRFLEPFAGRGETDPAEPLVPTTPQDPDGDRSGSRGRRA